MHIFIVGKYPPIQGGVSTEVYHTVQELLDRRHRVTMLSNAGEVEEGLRCMLTDEEEVALAEPPGCEGRLRLINVAAPRTNSYVPWAKPYLTLLYGAGLDLLAESSADLILGWYLEPYGVAAALLAEATATPLALRAAGSDLGRLADHPDLRSAYTRSAQSADAILMTGSSPAATGRWTELGVPQAALVQLQSCRLPAIFRPEGPSLPLERPEQEAEAWARRHFPPGSLTERMLAHRGETELGPVIGMYSKVGDIKGTFDLCNALEQLAADGVAFQLRLLAPGKREDLEKLIAHLGDRRTLARHTRLLPPLPPWRVPDFIRGCDIVCCLERRFPVSFHAPRLPREVLACAAALVISEEIAAKQPFAESLVHRRNCIRIADPRDHRNLADELSWLLADQERRMVLAKHGLYISRAFEKLLPATNATANALEDIFGGAEAAPAARL